MGTTNDIGGRITYLNGEGVENATISIVDEGITTMTDEDGYYRLYDVPIGEQKIQVEKEGYNTYIYKVVVMPVDSDWENHHNRIDHESSYSFEISAGDAVINQGEYPNWGLISGSIMVCGLIVIIFSIMALIAGIFAVKRKNYKLAVAGAVFGLFTVVGTLLALIALVFLLISKKEFD